MELCAAHRKPSLGSCTRCGVFVCDHCRKWMSEKPFCAECLRRLGDKPSREALWALGLATLGMLLWFPGLIAIPLAGRELERIRSGHAPEAGRDFASLARGLGWFEAAVGGAAIGVWLYRAFM
jgi:hypothetical protein